MQTNSVSSPANSNQEYFNFSAGVLLKGTQKYRHEK